MTTTEKVQSQALNLTTEYPRSPRETLGGYVIACRTLDKCRATLAGTEGEYHFDCPLDGLFFEFTGITSDDFKDFVATGAPDLEVAAWIQDHAKKRDRVEIIKWNNDLRYKRISELPDELQEFLEDYIPKYIPDEKVIQLRYWFDVYDLEEGRL